MNDVLTDKEKGIGENVLIQKLKQAVLQQTFNEYSFNTYPDSRYDTESYNYPFSLNRGFLAELEIDSDMQLNYIRKIELKIINANIKEPKKGDVIKIINMKGEPQYTGKTGEVTYIDDIGQVFGTWGSCAIIPEIDTIEILSRKEN